MIAKVQELHNEVRLIVEGLCGIGGIYKTCVVVNSKAIKLRSEFPIFFHFL